LRDSMECTSRSQRYGDQNKATTGRQNKSVMLISVLVSLCSLLPSSSVAYLTGCDKRPRQAARTAIQVPGFAIAAAGKIMFGWFAQHKAPAWMALVGTAMAAIGVSIVFVTSTSFQTECDPAQTASLVALGGFLRNVAAAITAAVMIKILKAVGWRWAFTGLGMLDLICIPGILLILMRGQKWREDLKRQQQQG
jgi:MFS family permease